MSQADVIFKRMCEDILENGTDNKGEEIRPRWDDGEPAYTLARFGVVNRYDLSKEFPALTFRKVAFKTCIDELLWIWQRQSENIHDLKGHIWDSWADNSGSIGKAYGYQQAKRHFYTDVKEEALYKAFGGLCAGNGHIYAEKVTRDGRDGFLMTQLDKAIYDLRTTPFSRRILVTMWNPEEQYEMHLAPCAYEMTFMVTKDTGTDGGSGLILNGILNQRSNDLLAAGNWNVVQYSVLIYMIAHICGMKAGELVHVIGNAHIYDRHVDIIKELIKRPQYPAPKFSIARDVRDFYDFTVDDFSLTDYEYGPQVENIPVAV
ncbi:MAG: thymidylate synthase [Lachnospiraceae bacterium]|nr:thymidylate synthase [Lachnospiraceae bacterium]